MCVCYDCVFNVSCEVNVLHFLYFLYFCIFGIFCIFAFFVFLFFCIFCIFCNLFFVHFYALCHYRVHPSRSTNCVCFMYLGLGT